jgi:branched-chain amino acid transport system permease protein
LRGEIFALLTLAVPFILAALIRISPQIDGGQGVPLPVPDYVDAVGGFQSFVYLVSLAIAVLAVGIAFAMQHSRTGWALFAVRDAENVGEGLGVPTFRFKMLAIAFTGGLAAISGSVYALQIGFVTVEGVFNLTVPLFVIVMSVLGGRLFWAGPLLGAVVIHTLRDRLSAGGFEGLSLIVLGLVLATLVLLAPEGLVARLRIRQVPVTIAFIGVVTGLAITRVWGAPLDWLAAGMVAAAIVAFLPVPRRRLAREVVRLTADFGDLEGEPATTGAGAASPRMVDVAPAPPDRSATPPAKPATVPVIECIDVARTFGGVRALQGISLAIHDGELLGLVGPNGSGKTTLVNLLSGSFPPTSGDIRFDGRSIVGMPPHRLAHLGVARTYQIPRPFESMTVRDNIAVAIMFGRDPRSLAAARRAAQEQLDLVGLTALAEARPTEINLHQRQLLEMARALATRPRILLLDEALAGLSPVEIDEAAQVVRRIHGAGVTIVLVEHLLRVVNQLATRVLVVDQGRALADGEPAVVMRDPAVVRAYLGSQADA